MTPKDIALINTSKDLFYKHFGKAITDYEAFKTATTTVNKTTKDLYARVLPKYFLYLDMDPDQVIAQREKDIYSNKPKDYERFERLTIAYIKSRMEQRKDVSGDLSRIQGFFRNHGKRYALDLAKLKVSKAKKKHKYSPTNEEVRNLLSHADNARNKLLITLMYQTGCSPKDASRLRIKDFPQEDWAYSENSRSKTGEVWRHVTTPDIADALKTYMLQRPNTKPTDPLFVGREGPLNNESISYVIGNLIEKSGYNNVKGFSAKSFRDSFEDACVDAKIHSKLKKALMGHHSDIEDEYGSWQKMVDNLVESAKQVYQLLCLTDNARISVLQGLSEEDWLMLRDMIAWYKKQGKDPRSL